LRIARVAKENVEPKESIMTEEMDDNRGNPMVKAMLSDPYSNTYAIVNNNGDAITADEIESQTNIQIPPTLEEFIFEGYPDRIGKVLDGLNLTHNIFNFRLLPPITRSFKIICLAFNYKDQDTWLRFGKFPPKDPVIYMKARTSLIGAFEDITCPSFVKQLDYEGELALVIDKKCRDVEMNKALEYVGGYFVLNDISARDVQFIDKQYSRAKSFDTFGPCGPWIVTRDEIPDPNDLQLITKVNEVVRQRSSTSKLVLNIERIVNSLSNVMTLEAGDIISTGTPSGTALSMSSHLKYLQHGDIVEVEVEGIGKIRNKVKFVNK
jgi:2-keto-4-pentenoate hydratase/2-oxohepta-3-ene-1,7-dioic acid hydratase in catechol pathway